MVEPHVILLNPNTSTASTAMMLGIARETLAGAATIEGMTALAGAPIITDPAALAVAAAQIAAMAGNVAAPVAGMLVAAFGDPGLDEIRARSSVPATGLAEAAIREAAAGGRRFAIVTTTPALDAALRHRVASCAPDGILAGIHYTRSGAAAMIDAERLHAELAEACALAVSQDRAETIIIGGGPLAAAARRLRHTVPVELIEPIPAAMRLMLARVAG